MRFRFPRNIYPMLKTVLPITIALLPAGGCATSEPGIDSCSGRRVVVSTVSGSRRTVTDLQTILEQTSGKPVHYMRTLFGPHYLFCVYEVSGEQEFSRVMARMKEPPDVRTVEPDRRRTIQ